MRPWLLRSWPLGGTLLLLLLAGGISTAQGPLYPTTDTPVTSYITSAASTNATSVKAGPGNVYGYSLINTTATLYYLRMYNLAAAPTCSSATGFVETIPIPASTTGAGVQRTQPNGQTFSAGIGYCLTGGGTSTDNTNAAVGLYVTLLWK
jgi:hypothetical protein